MDELKPQENKSWEEIFDEDIAVRTPKFILWLTGGHLVSCSMEELKSFIRQTIYHEKNK